MGKITQSFFAMLIAGFAVIAPLNAQTIWDGTTSTNWTGKGTEADPYLISTAEQLAGFAASVNDGNDFEGLHVKLGADVYLSDVNAARDAKKQWTPIGGVVYEQTDPNDPYKYVVDTLFFKGTFDGGEHTVYDLYYNTVPDYSDWDDPLVGGDIDFTGWNKGFFGYLDGGTIKNLRLNNATVIGAATTGGLVTINDGGSIINCSIGGIVASISTEVGGEAGGLVGRNVNGIIENCSSSVDVKAPRGAGGLAGRNEGEGAVIRDSYATGKAYCSQYNVGGLVGYNGGLIEKCYAAGEISRAYYQYAVGDAGGFAGVNEGIISNSYATGNVVSNMHGAGFCGRNLGRIESCFAAGNVSCGAEYAQASPFVLNNGEDNAESGLKVPGIIINCFAVGKATATATISNTYGFLRDYSIESRMINCCYNSEVQGNFGRTGGVSMKTTAEMQNQAFVDTLNMFAALCGTSTWKYNANSYPTPTGVKATNIADYLESGSGTIESPFNIRIKEQLKNFVCYVNGGYDFREQYVKLADNIAVNAPYEEWGVTMPTQWTPIGNEITDFTFAFRGTFDGGFHEISNLYMDNFNEHQGFFGVLENGAHIKNLGVVNAMVKTSGSCGVIAGISGKARKWGKTRITQCWTSGQIESRWAAGGILGVAQIEHSTIIKNCYSTVQVKGLEYASAIVADKNKIALGLTDTVANCYFVGTLSTNRTNNQGTEPFGAETYVNCYFNNEKVTYFPDNVLGKSTAYLQSKDFVNVLNYYTEQNNEYDSEKLMYWQHNADAYPTLTNARPPYNVTYVSNGGSPITTQPVLDNTYILAPKIPTREGYVFYGWCANEGLTEIFDFDNTPIVSDIALYAKWQQKIEPDYSIFNNPFATTFTITTKEQLAAFAATVNGEEGVRDPKDFKDKTVKLGNDIIVNDTLGWKQWGRSTYAPQWDVIGYQGNQFRGTFDGDGHIISGVYINNPEYSQQGLFGHIGAEAVVKNLGVKASFVGASQHAGILAGCNQGEIDNCYAIGNVSTIKDCAGVLVGANDGVYSYDVGGSINNSYAIGNVNGTYNIGGLTGTTESDSICNCYAIVNVGGTENVGGLIGNVRKGYVRHCHASGSVTGTGDNVGGLVGIQNEEYISDSYVQSYVSGRNNVGGLVGTGTDISNCYTEGEVVGERYTGGLAGIVSGITRCYKEGMVRGTYYVGGLAGQSGNLQNCYALANVSGNDFVGGLAGSGTAIINSYAVGAITIPETATSVGALVGTSSSSVTNSYYNSEISGRDTDKGTPKITVEMKRKDTYEAWDFTETWGRKNTINNAYPYLRWSFGDFIEDDADPAFGVTGVSLDKENVSLSIDETVQLTAIVLPDNAANKTVVWTSSNTDVATVKGGLVSALTIGTATITVTTEDGNFTADCIVQVKGRPDFYLCGDAIPNSKWTVPPTNPLLLTNNENGTYSVELTTEGGAFNLSHEDVLTCVADDWDSFYALSYAPVGGNIYLEKNKPLSLVQAKTEFDAFRIRKGTYAITVNMNDNTISAQEATGLLDTGVGSYFVYTANRQIIIENAKNSDITIYNAIGQMVCHSVIITDIERFSVPCTGIYVVKVGNAMQKVMVK